MRSCTGTRCWAADRGVRWAEVSAAAAAGSRSPFYPQALASAAWGAVYRGDLQAADTGAHAALDAAKRRISLGLKQTLQNPWEAFAERHPVGSIVEGEVKNKTEFGLFIGLDGDVDGMVHLSDLDWSRPGEQAIEDYKKGDTVTAKVLDVDVEKERIAIGVKQLANDPFAAKKGGSEDGAEGDLRKGSVVTCEVVEVKDGGIEVKIAGSDLTAFIKRNELARDRGDQRPERFSVGEKVDARITQFDRRARKVAVSIKALEVAEEKEAIAQYGSADSGASLGDILGAALKARDKSDKAK